MLECFVSTGAALAQWGSMLTGFWINVNIFKNYNGGRFIGYN